MASDLTFIPANPGFFVVVEEQGATLHLPVIAWWVDRDGAFPVTVDGVERDAVVVGPDGKRAHR